MNLKGLMQEFGAAAGEDEEAIAEGMEVFLSSIEMDYS